MATGLIFTNPPTWTGSLPTWALLLLAVVAAWRISRGGGGSAVTELTAANKVLEERDQKRETAMQAQAKQIAALESKTDVVLAVTPLIADHERHAQERHTATIEVLEAIRDQIHADTNGKDNT